VAAAIAFTVYFTIVSLAALARSAPQELTLL
jgi:hypothetical protein